MHLKELQPVLAGPDVLEGGRIPDVPLALLLLLREPGADGHHLALALLHLLVHRTLNRITAEGVNNKLAFPTTFLWPSHLVKIEKGNTLKSI